MNNKATVIEYKPEFLDLVKDLTQISMSVIFEKNETGDSVVAKRRDSEKVWSYILKAPIDYFKFDNKEVSFYKYMEFYQFFKSMNSPKMKIDGQNIYLISDKSRIEYNLVNTEAIKDAGKDSGRFNKLNFDNPDFKFAFTTSNHDEIVKMLSLIKAERVRIHGNNKEINFKIFSQKHQDIFETHFEIENLTGFTDDIDFVILSDTFLKIPPKRNYSVEVKKDGFIKFHLIDTNISLDIFTAACI